MFDLKRVRRLREADSWFRAGLPCIFVSHLGALRFLSNQRPEGLIWDKLPPSSRSRCFAGLPDIIVWPALFTSLVC